MNVTNVIIEREVAADTFINLYSFTKLYKICLHSQNRHHSQTVQLTTSVSPSEPLFFLFQSRVLSACRGFPLMMFLLNNVSCLNSLRVVVALSLSSCVADSEIRLHKYTWQHQKQLCVSKTHLSALPAHCSESEIISAPFFFSLSWLLSFPFKVFFIYWVSFLDFQ